MIREEWKSLLKRKFNIIVLIAVLFIPTIYTTIFLASMWDPYGKISNLPVAVVNEDTAAKYNGKTLTVGEDLVDELKKSDALDFHFTNKVIAEDGLKNGTYYMVIIIPETFSANAATVTDDKPAKMQLNYQTNPGMNYISSKMSETAMLKIKANLSEEVTKTYAKAILKEFTSVGDGLSDASDGSGKVDTALFKTISGNQLISDKLKTLSAGGVTFVQGSDTFAQGLTSYTSGVSKLNSGLSSLSNGISSMTDSNGSLNSGIQELSSAQSKLSTGVTSYTGGVSQLYSGSSELAANSSALTNGVSAISDGVTVLHSGSSSLLASLNTMSDTLNSDMSDTKKAQLTQLESGLISLNNSIQSLSSSANDLSDELDSLSGVSDTLKNASTSANATGDDLSSMKTIISELKNSGSLSAEQQGQLQTLSDKLDEAETNNGAAESSISDAASTINADADLSKMKTQVSTLKQTATAVASTSNALLPASSSAVTDLESGLTQVITALDRTGSTSDTMGLIQAVGQINSGLSTISSSMTDKSTGLIAGVTSYTNGVSSLNSGLQKLNANSSSLTGGMTAYTAGFSKFSLGLTDGLNQLQTGVSQLGNGSQTLVANNSTLLDGASSLSDAAGQISAGASKLADGSTTLGTGLSKIENGVSKLTDSLSKGASKITDTNTGSSVAKMIAAPVTTNETKITTVENNGHAMAAYMMSVGLWISALAFCIVIPMRQGYVIKTKKTLGIQHWAAKASIFLPIAVIQALIMVGMLHVINGFEPANLGKTLLVAVVAAVTFMSIIVFVNVALGLPGNFLILIVMVLQLAGCGGTYPIVLSGGFFEKITRYLPFTYSVQAFRSTISGGTSITGYVAVLCLIALVATLLTIISLRIKNNVPENATLRKIHLKKAAIVNRIS